ncbi:hypothetical protein M9H77_09607 [Catharanthus roseus]|uniref:Uncharacterized protein n=1 Tax=Catharanthus roseus TaxID=4058 RepID=A0ACC0C1F3_CATRO|nr:hypothetical protein M9H77_09607 [Catharanthus roseus]
MTIFCKILDIQVVVSNGFLISCLVFQKSSPDPCQFSTIYDPSSNSNSYVFWNQLQKIMAIFFGPWLVFGDFNNIPGQLDKTGGCPISPALFAIYFDLLSRMITRVENENNIQGIKVCRTSPSISHFMYADNLTIFCGAKLVEAANVHSVVNDICQPKSFGGQGFRISLECNKAILAKLNWRIYTKPDTLWVQLIKAKYLRVRKLLNL